MLIQDQFGIILNLQTSPIPQTSFLPWTFLAASYSKAALIYMAFGMILLSNCCMLYTLVHVLEFSIKSSIYQNSGCHLLHRSGVLVVLRTSESAGPWVMLQSSVDDRHSGLGTLLRWKSEASLVRRPALGLARRVLTQDTRANTSPDMD